MKQYILLANVSTLEHHDQLVKNILNPSLSPSLFFLSSPNPAMGLRKMKTSPRTRRQFLLVPQHRYMTMNYGCSEVEEKQITEPRTTKTCRFLFKSSLIT